MPFYPPTHLALRFPTYCTHLPIHPSYSHPLIPHLTQCVSVVRQNRPAHLPYPIARRFR